MVEYPRMSEDLTPAELVRRQLLARVRSLHAAGVDWLPIGLPLEIAPSVLSTSAAPDEAVSSMAPSLLDVAAPDATAALTLEHRQQALRVLADEVSRCTRCTELCSTRTQTVFGQGKAGAELCFIGEAPGADEDRQGIPFVGAAGQMLNRILVACGLQREEVYICNILRCRPPGNRTPLPNEAENCRDFLERQLALVRPKYICCLGSCAAHNLLQTTASVGKLRKRFHDYRGMTVLVTYHPSYLLRSPEMKREAWEDMKLLLTRMGRPIPRRNTQ